MESFWLVFFTIFVGTIGVLIYLRRRDNYWSKRGIPHLPSLPIIGSNLSLFTGKIAISNYVSHIYNYFPDVKYFGLVDFGTPVVVLRDAELIKEIGIKNFDNFIDRKSFLDEAMDPVFGKNILALKGDRWRKMRNTLSPSFTATKMKFMFELIEKCASDFVLYFLDHPDETNSINTKDAFTRYTNDVIATAAFGISVNSMQDKENEFYVRGADASSFKGFWRFAKFIIFQIFPKVLRFFGQRFVSRSSGEFFQSVIRETLKIRKEKNIIRPDMIHLLMEARNKEGGIDLSIDDIVAQAFIFFLAGFESTSTTLCFVTHELAVNPEVQEKLRNEVDAALGSESGKISYETLTQMKYMDMVVSEALRKYPPSPLSDRICVKKYTLPKPSPESKEYTVEPNSIVWIPINGLHQDPKYFPNPEKFDPQRFSDENKDKMNPYAYLPFGLGPRKCIGNRFALIEVKLLLFYLMRNFIFERTEKTRYPLEYETNVLITVKGGFWIKFIKRV